MSTSSSTVKFVDVRGAESSELESFNDFGEIERLGGFGHGCPPLAIELGSFLWDERSPDLSRRNTLYRTGDPFCVGCVLGQYVGQSSQITASTSTYSWSSRIR